MTLTTRTAAKGIPPRVRSPAEKGKKKAAVVKAKEKRKRDEDENSDSPKSKKKKKTTIRPSKSSEASDGENSDIEVIEDDVPAPEDIEFIVDDGPSALGDEEVSKLLSDFNL